METLKKQVDTLVSKIKKEEIDKQVKALQEINRLILMNYMIKFDDYSCLYPIEVEAYYYHDGKFEDPYTHQNDLQKNRFGKFYFHRKTADAAGKFNCARGGVDICLSMAEDYYLSVLIRGIRINSICSKPNIIAHYIIGDEYYDEGDDCSNDVQKTIEDLEKDIYLCKAKNDPRGKDILINTERVGLSKDDNPYYAYKLRSLIEFGAKYSNKYPNRDDLAIEYFQQQGGEVTCERIKELLGEKSQKVYDHFNKK
jgi:hypothetical protein